MSVKSRRFPLLQICALWLLALSATGCVTTDSFQMPSAPRELEKVSQAPFRIEPPDILLIDAISTIPLPPYRIEPMDAIYIQASNTFPTDPIAAVYTVAPEGTVNLGLAYGSIQISGLTLEEAKEKIETHLKGILTPAPTVFVSLAQFRGAQQIRGEHLVHPDGTVHLGSYGSVYVADMTLDEAREAIEQHLTKFLQDPEIALDIFSYNSKVYYVITDGGGLGEQVYPFPIMGRETVLDAVAQINGLPAVASKHHVWIARPVPASEGDCSEVILPVNWKAITRGASTETNYQIFPGDRLYVMADPLVTMDTFLARAISPVERLFGFTLLGNSAVRVLQQGQGAFNRGGGGFGGF
jgi:polysaccharide export outer membrane protein